MILELRYIEKSFGEKQVLCGVSLQAEGGRVVLAGELREIKRNYPRERLVVRLEQTERI